MYKIDPAKVPPELRVAIPLAEKWGRTPEEGQKIELAKQASDEELQEFLTVFDGPSIQVLNAWLDVPDIHDIPDEQAAFMLFALTVSIVEQELERRELSNASG
jgi:hypothetical protein